MARQAGISVAAVRYYEAIGVLAPAARTSGGYRQYPAAAVEELRFVKQAQALGFALDDIAEILQLSRAGRTPCDRVLELSRRQVTLVEERIAQLTSLRSRLLQAITTWEDRQPVRCEGLCEIITGAE